jgi:hypothetical protein
VNDTEEHNSYIFSFSLLDFDDEQWSVRYKVVERSRHLYLSAQVPPNIAWLSSDFRETQPNMNFDIVIFCFFRMREHTSEWCFIDLREGGQQLMD